MYLILDHFDIHKIYKCLYYMQVQIHVQINKYVCTTVCYTQGMVTFHCYCLIYSYTSVIWERNHIMPFIRIVKCTRSWIYNDWIYSVCSWQNKIRCTLVSKQNTVKSCILLVKLKTVVLDAVKWMLYTQYSRCTWCNQMDALHTVM